LQLVASLLLDPGSRVLLTDPGYPCNRHFVTLAGGEPVGIPVGPASHYQLTAALVAQHWTAETRAVLLSSPSNPTGTVVPEAELAAIRDTVNRLGGGLIVDEIYHGLLYDTPESTALSLSDDVFVVNSFSKYFGMTGWRLGWLVVPPEYARPAEILAQNIFISASSIAQYAAVAAFGPAVLEICEQRREAFAARRDFLLPALRQLGFGVPVTPEGAFYIYADCTAFTDDSQPFCVDLLERTGVAFTPGLDFGSHRSHEHVRFAYTNSLDNLEIAVERLSQALAEAA
jgi:aspartate/methionine/tyrosine aminotransferase